MSAEFERVRQNDRTVYEMLRRGKSLEEIIVMLVAEKNVALKRIQELENIAPLKIKLPDGTVMIWRCPDELVPLR